MNKPNCSKHIVPEYLKDLRQVAIDIGDMPYDKLYEFLGHLSLKINDDAMKDIDGGRLKLGRKLTRLANDIDDARFEAVDIWKICEPYMTKNNNNDGN